MRLWSSPYTLRSREALSGKTSTNERSGSLLKVEFENGAVGFADIHPWPELGDLPLDSQLRLLSEGKTTSLTARSLALAQVDGEARAKNQNLFDGFEVPTSHFLVNNLSSLRADQVWAEGFRHLKVKLGRDPWGESRRLNEMAGELQNFRLRFDFNGLLKGDEFISFIERLPSSLRDKIEFVEDPVPWDEEEWIRLSVQTGTPLALDRFEGPLEQVRGFQWLILKPAIQDPEVWLARRRDLKLCLTSYLDHPVGQLGAAYEAARLQSTGLHLGACGLVSHFSWVDNEWTRRLSVKGARLIPPAGSGIGFDDLLHVASWSRIR